MNAALQRVYLRAGEAQCAAGASRAQIVERVLQPPVPPQRLAVRTPAGATTVPYCGFAEAQDPLLRLEAVARGALAALAPARRRAAGLMLGSSSGLLQSQEQDYTDAHARGDPAIALLHPDVSGLADRLAQQLDVRGPRLTVATACSAAANALLYGAWMVREAQADDVLVLGAEFRNRTSLLGFHGMLLLAPERCQPFDRDRAGVVLGETAAALHLSAEAPRAGETAWEILGGATLCDTSHPTSPAPQRIAQTIAQALDAAGVRRADIVAVKAHGTGTGSNDLAEALGIRAAFGARVPPVTSLKAHFGHTLGACGALETLAFAGCLERGFIPATGNFRNADPELALAPLQAPCAYDGGAVLLSYFGFGGNNCCLVLRPC